MYKLVNYEYVEMTPEEEAEYRKQMETTPEHDPSPDQRLRKVEKEVEDLSFIITGEVATNAQ